MSNEIGLPQVSIQSFSSPGLGLFTAPSSTLSGATPKEGPSHPPPGRTRLYAIESQHKGFEVQPMLDIFFRADSKYASFHYAFSIRLRYGDCAGHSRIVPIVGQNIALHAVPAYRASIST